MNKRFEDMQKYMDKRFRFIEALLIVLIGAVIGTNIYSIFRQNKLFAIKEKLMVIDEIQKTEKKIIDILIEQSKKDKSLYKKLKVAGFL